MTPPHHFEVGGKYANNKGTYEVLSIDGERMKVRYENGEVAELTVTWMWNAWLRIRAERQKAEETVPKSEKRTPRRKVTKVFGGFTEAHFEGKQKDWRRRGGAGTLLAAYLHRYTGRRFGSWAVARRNEVHVALRAHYEFRQARPYPKFFIMAVQDGLYFGLQMERPAEEMDDRWAWTRFIPLLEDEEIAKRVVLGPMLERKLTISVSGRHWKAVQDGFVDVEQDENEDDGGDGEPRILSPAELAAVLNELPAGERHILQVQRFMNKDDAIVRGSRVIGVIGQTCVSLLPLYYAILSENPVEETGERSAEVG